MVKSRIEGLENGQTLGGSIGEATDGRYNVLLENTAKGSKEVPEPSDCKLT